MDIRSSEETKVSNFPPDKNFWFKSNRAFLGNMLRMDYTEDESLLWRSPQNHVRYAFFNVLGKTV